MTSADSVDTAQLHELLVAIQALIEACRAIAEAAGSLPSADSPAMRELHDEEQHLGAGGVIQKVWGRCDLLIAAAEDHLAATTILCGVPFPPEFAPAANRSGLSSDQLALHDQVVREIEKAAEVAHLKRRTQTNKPPDFGVRLPTITSAVDGLFDPGVGLKGGASLYRILASIAHAQEHGLAEF